MFFKYIQASGYMVPGHKLIGHHVDNMIIWEAILVLPPKHISLDLLPS